MKSTIGVAAALLSVTLAAYPLPAQEGGPRCQCPSLPPEPGTGGGIVVGTPPDGGGGGGGGGDGLIGLVPLGPIAAILAAKGVPAAGVPLLAGDSTVAIEPSAAVETRAAIAFRANIDSLAGGMRAPDTATPHPAVLALGASLLLAGGLLLRGPSA